MRREVVSQTAAVFVTRTLLSKIISNHTSSPPRRTKHARKPHGSSEALYFPPCSVGAFSASFIATS